jgi:hypothetical protein
LIFERIGRPIFQAALHHAGRSACGNRRLEGVCRATWNYDRSGEDIGRAGGTLEVNGEALASQIVNGCPAVARFSAANYAKAKRLAKEKGLHLMDALTEVGFSDAAMMSGLARRQERER